MPQPSVRRSPAIVEKVGGRTRQLRRILADGGPREVGARALQRLVKRLDVPDDVPPVRTADVLAADIGAGWTAERLPLGPGEPMQINIVTTPPATGSGGHTTTFRLISYLEARGNVCRVYLYDVYGGDARFHEQHIRSMFPALRAEILDVEAGLSDAHTTVATSWPTAYPVFNARVRGDRTYLVQDFEPWFYPRSSSSALSEATYRMGFHAVTAGRWLSMKLSAEYGMDADPFEFGCDTERYHLTGAGPRDGIVFYARPGAPRRAFEIGMMALELFAAEHPDTRIHLYGKHLGSVPFPAVDHGLLTPDQLNDVYNRCYAGLSLSMTNVSLVPHEMLAAGCLPVVNDADHNRIVLDNDHVRYAEPSPRALADALAGVVAMADFDHESKSAAGSVETISWDDAGAAVEAALRRRLTT